MDPASTISWVSELEMTLCITLVPSDSILCAAKFVIYLSAEYTPNQNGEWIRTHFNCFRFRSTGAQLYRPTLILSVESIINASDLKAWDSRSCWELHVRDDSVHQILANSSTLSFPQFLRERYSLSSIATQTHDSNQGIDIDFHTYFTVHSKRTQDVINFTGMFARLAVPSGNSGHTYLPTSPFNCERGAHMLSYFRAFELFSRVWTLESLDSLIRSCRCPPLRDAEYALVIRVYFPLEYSDGSVALSLLVALLAKSKRSTWTRFIRIMLTRARVRPRFGRALPFSICRSCRPECQSSRARLS
ncbi:hypothetical protein PM082_004224 [Marasmius tenuissimus]|nr:hypothetical protein PM082_004224 [Marasmius tenuissimus]